MSAIDVALALLGFAAGAEGCALVLWSSTVRRQGRELGMVVAAAWGVVTWPLTVARRMRGRLRRSRVYRRKDPTP
jgi:hypothetical protein